MGSALEIGGDPTAEDLRRAARRERDGRAAARMYAIANALEEVSRAEAARLAGMERQALRDAVLVTMPRALPGCMTDRKGARNGGSIQPRKRISRLPSCAVRTLPSMGAAHGRA